MIFSGIPHAVIAVLSKLFKIMKEIYHNTILQHKDDTVLVTVHIFLKYAICDHIQRIF